MSVALPSGTPSDVLFITLDSCRFDSFESSLHSGLLPNLGAVGPLHRAQSPSYFTYGSHASFWMGFTPGVEDCSEPLLNPKAGKLFRMAYAGHAGNDGNLSFNLEGKNIIDGFRRNGYCTIGTGAVSWFDTSTDTGSVLSEFFDHFYYAGDTWSLLAQLRWIENCLLDTPDTKPRFVFLNIGETHVPYWHEGAHWDRWPSPCVPFGSPHCSASESSRRQRACLEWIDTKLASLLNRFSSSTVFVCADHGDCWGEDGLWEHGISHSATLTVPLLLRVRGLPIQSSSPYLTTKRSRLLRFLTSLLP